MTTDGLGTMVALRRFELGKWMVRVHLVVRSSVYSYKQENDGWLLVDASFERNVRMEQFEKQTVYLRMCSYYCVQFVLPSDRQDIVSKGKGYYDVAVIVKEKGFPGQ